jgi:FeS assembly SUF system protein
MASNRIEENINLENTIVQVLKTIYDPEIPVNIYDLGLIYEIRITDDREIRIRMTLTSPNCPVAESLPVEVKEKVSGIEKIKDVQVEIVFDPPWSREMLSEEALLELGFL